MSNLIWFWFHCFILSGPYGLPSRLDDDVAFPTDIKLERPDDCTPEEDKDFKICVVCGERASGYYFGALVCLPCKVHYQRHDSVTHEHCIKCLVSDCRDICVAMYHGRVLILFLQYLIMDQCSCSVFQFVCLYFLTP